MQGENNTASCIRNTGIWYLEALHPAMKVRSTIGEAMFDNQDSGPTGWSGKGILIRHSFLKDEQTVSFSLTSFDETSVDTTKESGVVTAEVIKERFTDGGWLPHVEKSVLEVRRPLPFYSIYKVNERALAPLQTTRA